MKKTTLFLLLISLITAFSFTSCKDEDDEYKDEYGEYKEINDWIGSKMNTYYLWTKQISSDKLDQDGHEAPKTFYKSLLYSSEDHWSYITDDYSALLADLQGTPVSMGYAPLFGQFQGSDNVFIIVAYVYTNTPASEAGLERGNIILKINGTQLTTSNYQSLFTKATQTLGLAEYDSETNNLFETGETLSVTAEVINVNPVIHSEVINAGEKTIGYIALAEFIAFESFSTQVETALSEFVAAGVNELIVDLRYNLGGYVTSAVWLASALAPISDVEQQKRFIDVDYNYKLQPEAELYDFDRYLFEPHGLNLNLENIYFLTGQNTASASELVISGLQPFMNVVTIGETTHGKYVGSSVFPTPDEKVSHNYAIMPIILEYANIDGASVKNGIIPTVAVDDNVLEAVPFGNQSDPLLNQAMEMITGISKSGVKSAASYPQVERLLSNKQKLKMNLIED